MTTLPAVMVAGRLAWAGSAAPVYLAFRSGASEYRCSDAYQEELRAVVASLRALGCIIDAFEWETTYAPANGRLTGTCHLPAGHLPTVCGPVLAAWLRRDPARYISAAQDNRRAVACTPVEGLALAVTLKHARPDAA